MKPIVQCTLAAVALVCAASAANAQNATATGSDNSAAMASAPMHSASHASMSHHRASGSSMSKMAPPSGNGAMPPANGPSSAPGQTVNGKPAGDTGTGGTSR